MVTILNAIDQADVEEMASAAHRLLEAAPNATTELSVIGNAEGTDLGAAPIGGDAASLRVGLVRRNIVLDPASTDSNHRALVRGLSRAASTLQDALATMLGANADLIELGVLAPLPGAPAQGKHTDGTVSVTRRMHGSGGKHTDGTVSEAHRMPIRSGTQVACSGRLCSSSSSSL